jgi:hypothetical protein
MMLAIMSIRASVDSKDLGPIVLEYLARSLERGLEARDRSDPARFIDVDYRTFTAAPIEQIERIYAHFGLDWSPATEAAMLGFLDENPQHKHGTHHYSLEEFGLSAEGVRERLRFYTERFGLR